MKTQILLRSVLIAVALCISLNNNGSIVQPATHNTSYYASASETQSSRDKQTEKVPHNNTRDDMMVYIPQPNDDHDYECFDFKHHQKRSFWRAMANKLFVFLYDIIVLCPVAAEIVRELLHHA